MSTTKTIHEFDVQKLERSCNIIFIGQPGTGKSNTMEYICYMNRHKYPCIKVWSETDNLQNRFSKFAKPLFITNGYVAGEHEKSISRQQMCIAESNASKKGATEGSNPSCIYIMDDCNADNKLFKTTLMQKTIKYGTQWYDCLFMIGMHYAIDLPPGIRKSLSYVALFREPSVDERHKLFKNFAVGCTFLEFCDLMDQLTGDYTCLIFKKKVQSNKLEDCCFYLKAPDMKNKKWKFGSKEYRKWGKARYNKSFKETY